MTNNSKILTFKEHIVCRCLLNHSILFCFLPFVIFGNLKIIHFDARKLVAKMQQLHSNNRLLKWYAQCSQALCDTTARRACILDHIFQASMTAFAYPAIELIFQHSQFIGLISRAQFLGEQNWSNWVGSWKIFDLASIGETLNMCGPPIITRN